jgi:serine/threonine protein kinase
LADLKDKLEAVIRGEGKPSDVKAWLDQVLADGSVSYEVLLADLDAASSVGVPGPIITAFRSDITRRAAEAPEGDVAGAADAAEIDLTLDLPDDPSAADAPAVEEAPAAEAPADPPAAPAAAEDDGGFGNLILDDILPDPPADEPEPAAPAAEEGLDEAALFDAAATEMAEAEVVPAAAAPEAPAASGPVDLELSLAPLDGEAPPDDDATIIAAADDEDSDATLVVGDPESDATVVVGGDDDATLVTGDGGTIATGDGTYDPFAISEVPATGTAWPAAQPAAHGEVGPGTVLKERFELMEKLGEGGMGAVYKARDLLKVEAKDRNPYVAVKLLSGDFKEHPEAFIALQRETSKAQKLAHPNIATVYDFDRDRGTVYMTMEVLEGAELNDFIKKTIPDDGLEVLEAMEIVGQLCEGLKYAHNRGLVHSDFKPGNCFITHDGTVKLLDFGIARASATKAGAEGDKTLFDPGELGALTPAYATIEMFEGLAPDPRDDMYALACTAYELLNKKHPFKKRSAVKAREMGLKPAPLKKLTRRQNRVLLATLGLAREDRPESVEEFWDEIRPRKDYTWYYVGGGVAATALIAALSYGPITEHLQESDDLAFVAEVRSQGPHTVESLTTALQPALTMSVGSKDRVLGLMEEEYINLLNQTVGEIANDEDGHFEYARALELMQGARLVFAGNVDLALSERDVISDQESISAERANSIETLLRDDLLEAEESDLLIDHLNVLRQVNPTSDSLGDPRIPEGFAGLAEQSRNVNQLTAASDYLAAGLAFAPNNPLLVGLKARVDNEVRQQQNAERIGELQQQLTAQLEQSVSADTALPLIEPLIEMQALQPENPVIPATRERIRNILEGELVAAAQVSDFARAEDLMSQFARGVAIPWLMERRTNLSRSELDAGFQPEDLGARLAQLNTLRDGLNGLLTDATMDVVWESDVRSGFLDIVARMQTGDTWVEQLQQEIADAYMVQARDLMSRNLYPLAQESIDKAARYFPTYSELAVIGSEFQTAYAAFEVQAAAERRSARIRQLQGLIRSNAAIGDMDTALTNLTELRSGDLALPPSDPFLTTESPQLMAAGYGEAATREAASRRFTNAANLSDQGLQYLPGDETLVQLRDNARRAARLQQSASSISPPNVAAFDRELRAVTAFFADNASAIRSSILNIAAQRVNTTADVDAQVALMEALKAQFPQDQVIRRLEVDTSRQPLLLAGEIQAAFDAAQLTQAEQLIARANREQSGNSAIGPLRQELVNRRNAANATIQQLQQAMAQGNAAAARGYLQQAESQWSDNTNLTPYRQQLGVSSSASTSPANAADGSKYCRSNLAGQGTRGSRAYCFDVVVGAQGPDLVVVPPSQVFASGFAISRTEITIGHYNRYCQSTSQCSALTGNADLPATGMNFSQAQGFAQWLSQQTGKDYHIPTAQEWLYAATATDPDANRSDWNCRVVQGGSVLKGNALLPAATGRPNPWGLVHAAGNAQEFVADGTAHGGAHTDPLTECSVSLSRPASEGSAPTGFRVARALDN